MSAPTLARNAGIQHLVVTEHIIGHPNSRSQRALKRMELIDADAVTAVSGAVGDSLVRDYGVARQRVRVVPNGADLPDEDAEWPEARTIRAEMGTGMFRPLWVVAARLEEQKGHAILLDRGAKSDSIPGLEIETNEVKATHSASVAQMDENQIFYLTTRGLGREGAKREIVAGFLEPLSRKMGPTIRAWVNYLMENKWQGKPLMLKADEAMEQILEVEKSRYRETQDLFEKHYKYR